MIGINKLDLVFIVLIGIFSVRGLFHGLLEEGAAFLGLFIGFMLANRYLADVTAMLQNLDVDVRIKVVIAYVLIFASALVAAFIISKILRKILVVSFTAWLDHVAGAALGAAKGIVLCLLVYIGFQFFAPNSELLQTSSLAPYLAELYVKVLEFLPELDVHGNSWITELPV